jgi:hypothetical protein
MSAIFGRLIRGFEKKKKYIVHVRLAQVLRRSAKLVVGAGLRRLPPQDDSELGVKHFSSIHELYSPSIRSHR